jgi:hypothetical protein
MISQNFIQLHGDQQIQTKPQITTIQKHMSLT